MDRKFFRRQEDGLVQCLQAGRLWGSKVIDTDDIVGTETSLKPMSRVPIVAGAEDGALTPDG